MMDRAFIGISAMGQVDPPPKRPTMMSLPPLVRKSKASDVVAGAPTRSIAACTGLPPAAWMICCAASGAAPSMAASAPASSAAWRLAGSMSTTMAPAPPSALMRVRLMRPSPPAPKITTGCSR
ncbi:hypothetical protein D9M71_733200 [compost metagenome]